MFPLPDFNVFLDSLEEGVLFLDKERRVVAINEAATHMIGRNQEEVLRQLCPSVFAGTRCARECDDRGRCSLMPSEGAQKKIQDIALERADSRRVHLRMWALLLPPNEKDLYCAIVLRDRTREVELEQEMTERLRLGGMIGRSAAMQELYRQVLWAAASEATVLITGESGTGKELVARALHDSSKRAAGPYVPVHCAALPENLLESELFGHARGAFSGAHVARPGRFEAAHGGTLLLDEIGEIPPSIQVKLLRVLQEKEIVRLGENHARRVDVRVIAATHRDLSAMVRRGEFREDLYYRLRVLPLHVPPLRERKEDIPLLADKLLADHARRYERPPTRLDRGVYTAIEACDWPGNVRELGNALEYALVRTHGAVIFPEHLPPEVRAPVEVAAGEPRLLRDGQPLTRYYRAAAPKETEAAVILRMLDESGGNRAEAARRLGMSRTTLWKRLREVKPGQ